MVLACSRRSSIDLLSMLASRSAQPSMNQRISQELIRFDSAKASASSVSIADTSASSSLVLISMPAAESRCSASCMLALAASVASAQPAVCRKASRRGGTAPDALRDLVGDLPGVLQRSRQDAGATLALVVVAALAIECADRRLEAD